MVWTIVCVCTMLALGHVNGHDFNRQNAFKLLEESPLVDTHVDLPQIIRSLGMSPCRIGSHAY